MKDKGYFGIGVLNMKNSINYGTLFRTAQILDANFVFVIGARFKQQASDTMKSWRHIPTYEYKDFEDFNTHRPYDCELIGIELTDNARLVETFLHPKRAIYLLGAEDSGLSEEVMNKCKHIIKLQGKRSMNVAVAGSIVLYDRIK